MQWEQLAVRIKECHHCEGLNNKDLGTANAPGYGNKNSSVMIVGQSLCGKKCIESQIPFTGGSGLLLDKAFQLAGIMKSEIFITNVVKCHPPGNRSSKPSEISNCSNYLKSELELLNPEIIIPLGKDAWKTFGADELTTHLDKRVQDNSIIHYYYHPSYIMKNPKVVREEYINNLAALIRSEISK